MPYRIGGRNGRDDGVALVLSDPLPHGALCH